MEYKTARQYVRYTRLQFKNNKQKPIFQQEMSNVVAEYENDNTDENFFPPSPVLLIPACAVKFYTWLTYASVSPHTPVQQWPCWCRSSPANGCATNTDAMWENAALERNCIGRGGEAKTGRVGVGLEVG